MTAFYEIEMHLRRTNQVFDVVDQFARQYGLQGSYPRPLGQIRFYAVAQTVEDMPQAFSNPLELIMTRNPSGYHLFFDVVRLPDGSTRQGLVDGTYIIRVEGDYYQPLDIKVPFPMANPKQATAFTLWPNEAYPFPKTSTQRSDGIPTLLMGQLQDTNQNGLADVDVIVRVAGQEITGLTDDIGQWLLIFPDDLFSEGQSEINVTLQFFLSDQPDQPVHEAGDVIVVWGCLQSLPPIVLNN